jgi:uncharacterized membrane protein
LGDGKYISILLSYVPLKGKTKMEMNPNDKQPTQQPINRLGAGIAIGVGAGVALGIVIDNLAIGIAMGTGIGMIIGAVLEQRREQEDTKT